MRWLWVWLILVTTSVWAVSGLEYIWSARGIKQNRLGQIFTTQLPSRDLNNDRKAESIVLSTRIGTSQNGNTIKIFSASGKMLLQASFSSAGGCAIGPFIGRRIQITIWDYLDKPEICHTCDHQYNVTVYDWTSPGRLMASYYYRTKRAYPFEVKSKAPFIEFLSHRAQALNLRTLKRIPLDAKSLVQIKRGLAQYRLLPERIIHTYRVASWALVSERSSDGELGVYLFEKEGRTWKYLGGQLLYMSDHEFPRGLNIPDAVWGELIKGLGR